MKLCPFCGWTPIRVYQSQPDSHLICGNPECDLHGYDTGISVAQWDRRVFDPETLDRMDFYRGRAMRMDEEMCAMEQALADARVELDVLKAARNHPNRTTATESAE